MPAYLRVYPCGAAGSGERLVWKFDEYELVGNGLACWQILEGEQSAMVRRMLAALNK
ncbi:MAG: hypothetical protein O3B01_04865 [Planctomycetota bacterium]|nr:hypothetical protein [Planctomycetota bacterium]MDA1137890.1 hypothetical protein [Planctomycetota bacterium]